MLAADAGGLKRVEFYFDFISPFAYLASQSLGRLDGLCRLEYRPILFAALLQHHATRGPAEIGPMRRFTYRHIVWLAQRHGLALRLPPAHPFNPLPALRLALAAGSSAAAVDRIFRFIWAEGRDTEDPRARVDLGEELGLDAGTADAASKQQLRANTEQAIAAGVFGVPGFVVDQEIFWGFDALDFLADYLRDPQLLQQPAMRAADAVRVGISRRGPAS